MFSLHQFILLFYAEKYYNKVIEKYFMFYIYFMLK